MKKRLYVLSVVSLLALVACGTTSSSEGGTSSPNTSETETLYTVTLETVHSTAVLQGEKSQYAKGDLVVVNVTSIEEKYAFDRLEVKDANEAVVSYTKVEGEDLKFSFEMPESNVSVKVIAELIEYKVALPLDLPKGITMEADKARYAPGSEVKLVLRNTKKNEKRVDAVKMNGEVLEGKRTNDPEATLYEFLMPSEDAIVTADIVNVYMVSVDESCKEVFSLEGNVVAAAGETVEFVPVFFPGGWAKEFAAVEMDVELKPVEEKPGYYSFVMPDHGVTITARTGLTAYTISFDKENPYCSLSYLEGYEQKQYLPGEDVYFELKDKTVDANVIAVKINGVQQGPETDAEGKKYYSFVMPKSNVLIEPVFKFNYKEFAFVAGDSAHFSYRTETKVDGQVVDGTNHVLSSQEVTIVAEELPTETPHNFVVDSFKVYAGQDEASAVEVTNVYLTNYYDGTFRFNTSSSYMYYRFEAVEKEATHKDNPLAGLYNGFRQYYGTNQVFTIDYDDNARLGSGTASPLVPVENEPNHYKHSSSNYDVYYNGVDTFAYLSTSSTVADNGLYVLSKGKGVLKCKDRKDGTFSLAVKATSGATSEFQGIFASVAFEESDKLVTLYFDHINKKMYWNAQIEYLKDKNFDTMAVNDILVIKDAEGNVLQTVTVNKIDSSNSNGFRHYAHIAVPGNEKGTYTKGEESLTLDGFGYVTIGENKYEYKMVAGQTNMVSWVVGEETKYIEIDPETKTYVDSRGPKDGVQGEYTLGEETVTLDGYGEFKKGEETATYEVVAGSYLVVTKGETVTKYQIDKVNKTLTVFEGELSAYLNTSWRYEFEIGDGWDTGYYYRATISFTSADKCTFVMTFGYSEYDREYQNVYNGEGTYVINEDGSITITLPDDPRARVITLMPNGDNKLKVSEEVDFGGGDVIPAEGNFELRA